MDSTVPGLSLTPVIQTCTFNYPQAANLEVVMGVVMLLLKTMEITGNEFDANFNIPPKEVVDELAKQHPDFIRDYCGLKDELDKLKVNHQVSLNNLHFYPGGKAVLSLSLVTVPGLNILNIS